MHKKLFGLLATAVVGLTLTSCGGGGGGGGGGGESATVGAGVQGALNSLAGRTITYSQYQIVEGIGGMTVKIEFTFTSPETFTGGIHLNDKLAIKFTEATYWYDRLGDGRAFLRDVEVVSASDKSDIAKLGQMARQYEGVWGDIELQFNPVTGQLQSVDGNGDCSMR